jgi:hypothetical protein
MNLQTGTVISQLPTGTIDNVQATFPLTIGMPSSPQTIRANLLQTATFLQSQGAMVSGSYTLLDARYSAAGSGITGSFALLNGLFISGSHTLLQGLYQPSGTGVRFMAYEMASPASTLVTGTEAYFPPVPPYMNNYNLVYANAHIVSGTTGKTQVNIFNKTKARFMMTNPMTLELPKAGSELATGTQQLINTGTMLVNSYDIIQPVITLVSGTAPFGMMVTIGLA